MAARCLVSTVRRLWTPAVVVLLLVCPGWATEPQQKAITADATAATLVRAALESELAGDNQRRDALLRQALEQSPNDASVQWQLGRLRVDGAWKSPAEVERAAQGDQRLVQYRRLRDAAEPTVAGQTALALWCRKNRLEDEQRVHWLIVLQLQPDNAEAIAAMKLQPCLGTLMTPAQIAQVKKQIQEVSKAADRWQPLVVTWHSAAQRGDATLPTAVSTKLVQTSDEPEFLGLERTLWQQVGVKRQQQVYGKMLREMMPALGENRHPAAAASLARHAVYANFDEVRAAAVAGLKRHSLDHYAILLLGALQSPLEGKAVVDGPINSASLHYSLYQEGAVADLSSSHTMTIAFDVSDAVGMTPGQVRAWGDPDVPRKVAARKAEMFAARNKLNRAASDFYDAVERTNEQIAQRNTRITTALCQLTGQDLGDKPMKWWKWWWEDYNESYNVRSRDETERPDEPEKPVYGSTTDSYRLVAHSCFAQGTKVWTLTGQQPIEAIKVGDRVLAQNVDSGEVAYKPVLAVTTRPGGRWMKVGMGTKTITATPSHPFWVCGEGWRMTKQLKAGNRIHALSGGVPVENIETLRADPSSSGIAYNLIVADYSSYFVGDDGMLVHDNTPRMPTASILPGLSRRDAMP